MFVLNSKSAIVTLPQLACICKCKIEDSQGTGHHELSSSLFSWFALFCWANDRFVCRREATSVYFTQNFSQLFQLVLMIILMIMTVIMMDVPIMMKVIMLKCRQVQCL